MGSAEAGVERAGPSMALVLTPQITPGMSLHFQVYPLNAAASSLDIILTGKGFSDGHRKPDQLRRSFPIFTCCVQDRLPVTQHLQGPRKPWLRGAVCNLNHRSKSAFATTLQISPAANKDNSFSK